jgi:hypothetical protein
MIEIEPNPLLIQYIKDANALFCDFDGGKQKFIDSDEWHYVPSNLEQNIFLLNRIDELGLLPDELNICDCGIGLATAMFDFYLQSKDFKNKKFTFTGIEKCKDYIEFFNLHLKHHWNDELNIIEGEIMEQDYSGYNLIYSFSPFRTPRLLLEYYQKLADDIKPGSIIIENRNHGWGLESVLSMVENIKSVKIDDIVIFVKI